MRLFLVGLMGSGKSVLGRKISRSIQLPFIDLDDEIKKQEGATVSEVFNSKGEEYFRKVEAAVLRKQSEAKEFVMATGGGAPCFHDNMNFINQNGISIFLNVSTEYLLSRLDKGQREVRPMLAAIPEEKLEQKINTLLEKRLPYYEQAQITVNGASITAFEVLQRVHAKK